MNKLFTAITIVLVGLGYQATAGEVTTDEAYAKNVILAMEESATPEEEKAVEGESKEGEATEGESKEGEATEGESKEGEATEGEGTENTDESSDEGDEEVEG
jgi:uncharacterized low-complexity protein